MNEREKDYSANCHNTFMSLSLTQQLLLCRMFESSIILVTTVFLLLLFREQTTNGSE